MDIAHPAVDGSSRGFAVVRPECAEILPDLAEVAGEGRPASFLLTAELALAETTALAQPAAVWAEIAPGEADSPLLAGLPGKIAARVEVITGVVCTIGGAVEEAARTLFEAQEYAHGYLLDRAGTLAVARLARHVAGLLRQERGAARWAPGDDAGDRALLAQRVLFERVPAGEIGVRLTPENVMLPGKSLSFILLSGAGLGGARCLVPCSGCVWNGNCGAQAARRRKTGRQPSP